MQCVASEKLGKIRRIDDAAGRYIEFCKGTFPNHLSLAGLKIVVDSAHGAAYHIAPNVYRELGAEVISINDKPNGVNINDHCGATHLDSLQTAVMMYEADLGIAIDGDADRVMFVDYNGHVVDGDEILFILAQAAHQEGEMTGGVVGTLMSNLGLELALKQMDISFVRAKVVDRYVVEQLKETGWQLGGEDSGHILSLQHASTGDGIVASLQVLKAVLESGKRLAELKAGMTKLPQVLINVRLSSGSADSILALESVKQAVVKAEGILGDQGPYYYVSSAQSL